MEWRGLLTVTKLIMQCLFMSLTVQRQCPSPAPSPDPNLADVEAESQVTCQMHVRNTHLSAEEEGGTPKADMCDCSPCLVLEVPVSALKVSH